MTFILLARRRWDILEGGTYVVGLAALALLLAACATSPIEPTQQPKPRAQTPSGSPSPPPPAALKVQRELAERPDIPADQVNVVTAEQVQWPDTCLGLQRADELCAQVITPGWRVVLTAEGEQFEAHMDEQGERVR